jgi:hypothetical protein
MIRFRRPIGERGEGNFGCILWALVFILVAFIAWKAVPVKVASAKLHDFMDEQAKFAKDTPENQLYKAIIDKAKELDIPLDPKALEVERTNDFVKMRVRYTVPVEFPGYTYKWDFEHAVDRPIFYM